ncbi:hypothetical protein HDV03_004328 [Kappamyces sp. JEL0829]|nr:hypothetical protein HDV03_004328 [Kappamyces sp. JEL0829]
MPTVKVSEGVELYYALQGVGPHKVLFISGLGAFCHQWDMQVEYFAALPEFTVCIYDNRGAGLSSCPKPPYTTTMLADDAIALLDHLDWNNVHIVGLSMGGMIAQELAYKLGDRVMSLALLSTYSKFNGLPAFDNFSLTNPLKVFGIIRNLASAPPPTKTFEDMAAYSATMNFPKEWLDAKSKQKGKESLTNRQVIEEFQIQRIRKTGLQSAVGRAGQRNACLTHWVDKRLREIADYNYPKIVITGDKDEVLRQPVSSLYLAKQLKAELVIYPNGGHNIRLQDPQWLNERLLLHFRRGLNMAHQYGLTSSDSFDSFVTAEYNDEEPISVE